MGPPPRSGTFATRPHKPAGERVPQRGRGGGGAHAPARRRHWRHRPAPPGTLRVPRRQRAAPRSRWRRGHRVSRRRAAGGGRAGPCPSHLRGWALPAPRREARRAVRGRWGAGGRWAPCALDRAVPAAGARLARPRRAGFLAVPPEQRPRGLGLSRGSLAPVPRLSGSGGAEGARERWRGPGAAPGGARGSLSCPDAGSRLGWFNLVPFSRPKVRRNKA